MGQCWSSSRYNRRRGTKLSHWNTFPPNSCRFSPGKKDLARERPTTCFASPACSSWRGFLVSFAVSGVFFLLSCLLVLSMKSCGLVLAPGDSLAEIPAGIDGSWQLGTGGWVQAVLQSPGPVVQAGILMPSNAAIPLFAFPSARFHLLESVWKPGTFLLWLTQSPEEFLRWWHWGWITPGSSSLPLDE